MELSFNPVFFLYELKVIVNGMAIFRDESGATFRKLEGYIGAIVIFFALCLLLERAMHLLLAHRIGTAVIKWEG
jgi:hypothetical protein